MSDAPLDLSALCAPRGHLDGLVAAATSSLPPRLSPARQAALWSLPVLVAASLLVMVNAAARPTPSSLPNAFQVTAPAPVVRYAAGDSTVMLVDLINASAPRRSP